VLSAYQRDSSPAWPEQHSMGDSKDHIRLECSGRTFFQHGAEPQDSAETNKTMINSIV
jgi:hypothetical protein